MAKVLNLLNFHTNLRKVNSIRKWQPRYCYELMSKIKGNRDECPYSMNAPNIVFTRPAFQ